MNNFAIFEFIKQNEERTNFEYSKKTQVNLFGRWGILRYEAF